MSVEPRAAGLSPIERVILRLQGEGMAVPDIARKLNKKPGTVDRIIAMIPYREASAGKPPSRGGLRPVERVVLRYRRQGESYGEIGARIGKSGAHARRVEQYANFKRGGRG